MNIPTISFMRPLGAIFLLPLFALGLTVGGGSQALALGSSGYMKVEVVIHDNDTADMTFRVKLEGVEPEEYCASSKEPIIDRLNGTAEPVGDECVMKVVAAPLKELTPADGITIEKRSNRTVLTASMTTAPTFSTSLVATFPNKVSKASDNGRIEGNKVRWEPVLSPTPLTAESSSNSLGLLVWNLLGVFLPLSCLGLVLIALFFRHKNNSSPEGSSPRQGAQLQAQPGYGAGQPLTGTPYGQPQAYQQPGTAQQPPAAGQPYQQPGYGKPQGGQAPGSNNS